MATCDTAVVVKEDSHSYILEGANTITYCMMLEHMHHSNTIKLPIWSQINDGFLVYIIV
jgi:hypothetical protein